MCVIYVCEDKTLDIKAYSLSWYLKLFTVHDIVTDSTQLNTVFPETALS